MTPLSRSYPTIPLPTFRKSPDILTNLQLPPVSNIGNTPLIRLRKVCEGLSSGVAVYAKAEHLNPSGSVKDRTALRIILESVRAGTLDTSTTLIDSTSGNTGISYAMIGAALGIPVEIAMPESATEERKQTLISFGARLTLTDPDKGSDGAQAHVRQKIAANASGYFYADQYNNDANWHAHFLGTGREIIQQTAGAVTHFVAGLGTTGTFVGTTRRLREHNANIQCYSVEPDQPKHSMKGLRHMETAMIPGIYDAHLSNGVLRCCSDEAEEMTRRLAREEGLLVGVSSGANVAAAVRLASTLDSGIVVTVLCDNGNRYLSQPFWS